MTIVQGLIRYAFPVAKAVFKLLGWLILLVVVYVAQKRTGSPTLHVVSILLLALWLGVILAKVIEASLYIQRRISYATFRREPPKAVRVALPAVARPRGEARVDQRAGS